MIRKDLKYLQRCCCEDISLIENYEIAINSSEKYSLHHRLEIQNDKILSKENLVSMNLYYHRPAKELIFLTDCEHKRLHNTNMSESHKKKLCDSLKNHIVSQETRDKISKANTGISKNKGAIRSIETRLKISKSKLGKKINLSNEELKRRSNYLKKNNPSKNRDMFGINNPHYGVKVPEEQKRRQSEKMKGRHWYNNGNISISAFECPKGFVKGRLNGDIK